MASTAQQFGSYYNTDWKVETLVYSKKEGDMRKNLLKSLSNFVDFVPKHHRVFKSAAVATTTAAGNKHTLLLRRLRWSDVDEGKILSEISRGDLPLTKLCLPTSKGVDSPEIPFYCSAATIYYTALSSHNFSPIETPNFPHFKNYMFRGSCNGVICLDSGGGEEALFWNPTTNDVKFLPKSQIPRPECVHPSNVFSCVTSTGFGFDSESQDYKYIRWIDHHFERWSDHFESWRYEDTGRSTELYSLKNDSWKSVYCPHYLMSEHPNYNACLNGRAYWTLRNYDPVYTPFHSILCFDFCGEKFSTVPFPPSLKEMAKTHMCRLLDYGGRLGIVVHPNEGRRNENVSSFEVWAWNWDSNGGGWWDQEFYGCIEGVVNPLGFSEDGGMLFLEGRDRVLHVFDFGTKKLTKLDVYCNRHLFDLISYRESRFPLNGNGNGNGNGGEVDPS